MSERSEITERVRSYLLREVLGGAPPSDLTGETSLLGGGLLDSVTMIRLVVFLEENFSISIDREEVGAQNFDTIERIVDFVSSKAAAAG